MSGGRAKTEAAAGKVMNDLKHRTSPRPRGVEWDQPLAGHEELLALSG